MSATAGEATGEDRVVTVPNVITVVRLACIPLFLWLLFGRDDRLAAALLLAGLGATDWIDGFVARRFRQVSTLGKVLDPVADRVLLAVALVALLVDGSAPRWLLIAVLLREILISAAVLLLAALGATRIDVQLVGKAGTLCNMVAFPLFLASASDVSWGDGARAVAWGFAVPGLLLSWYALATYLPAARRALRAGREARVGATP